MAFNQAKYILDYRAKHKKAFSTDLNIEEMEELNAVLKNLKMNKSTFIRKSFILLKNQPDIYDKIDLESCKKKEE